MTDVQTHWERVYRDTAPATWSWYQHTPEISLALITRADLEPDDGIIDVGGGASRLVDELLDRGYRRLCVADVSRRAIEQSQTRLGARSQEVEWVEADICRAQLPSPFGLWHDRAVFHFLTDPDQRVRYRENLRATLQPGGYAIIATFAHDGPERCSGLPVVRYSIDALCAEMGGDFSLVESRREVHQTPGGQEQRFVYVLLRLRW